MAAEEQNLSEENPDLPVDPVIRSYVFYLSRNAAPGRSAILSPDGQVFFVRVQPFDLDDTQALDAATPQVDELTMNAHTFTRERV